MRRHIGLNGMARHTFADDVTAVSVLASAAGVVGGTNMDYWLYGLSSLASVAGLANLAGVGEMRYAFSNRTSLAELDFGGFDPSALTDLYCCFAGCASLEAIYADADWVLPESALGLMTFSGCEALVGGAGSAFDDARTSYEYLRIDALTKQVEKRNRMIERTFKLEQDMAVAQHDIESLKREEG